MKIHEQQLKKIHQEFDNSGGELSLSKQEFQEYFGLDQVITTKIIAELITTGRFKLIKEIDSNSGVKAEKIQVHPSYKRNYWLKAELEEREAEILLELGAQLKQPFSSGIYTTRRRNSAGGFTTGIQTQNMKIENNHIIHLDLRDQQLQSLPDSIGGLSKLNTLVLQNNNLTSIPDTIGSMQSLEVLNLTDNRLKSLPDVFEKLPNLKEVWLSGNHMVFSEVPKSLRNHPQLEVLVIYGDINLCSSEHFAKRKQFEKQAEEDEKRREQKEILLNGFEKKLNFNSFSKDERAISVDLFISHILPQVRVIQIRESTLLDGNEEVGEFLFIEVTTNDVYEDWLKGEYPDPLQLPFNIEFCGIGLQAENFQGDPMNTFYYQCGSSRGWPLRKAPFIEKEHVITIIRDMQSEALKEVMLSTEALRIQTMTLKELKRSMSPQFITAWIETLEFTVDWYEETFAREEAKWPTPNWKYEAIDTISPIEDLEDTLLDRTQDFTFKNTDSYKGAYFSSVTLTKRIRTIIRDVADAIKFLSVLKKEIRYLKRKRVKPKRKFKT